MKQYELRIHDERSQGSNILISFSTLLSCLVKLFPNILEGQWEIFQKAYGYGENVCKIEERLESENTMTINSEELFPNLLAGDEYFNNVRMKKIHTNIEIGVFDSTFLYMRGSRRELEKVGECFKKTEIKNVDERIM